MNIVYGIGERTRNVYVLGYVFRDGEENVENEGNIKLGKNKVARNWDWIELRELGKYIADGIEEGEIGLGVYSESWDEDKDEDKIGDFKDKNKNSNFRKITKTSGFRNITKISNFRLAFFKEDRIEDIFRFKIDWEMGWDKCTEIIRKKLEECDLVHGRTEMLNYKGENVAFCWEEIKYVGVFEVGNEIGVN